MRIENEMLSRFKEPATKEINITKVSLSEELDFFFDNVMNSVVEYFQEEIKV